MKKLGMVMAILAAIFYAFSTPISKILLTEIPSTMLAGLLYLGAGIGMCIVYGIRKVFIKKEKEESLAKTDLKYVIGMIILDILAPIFLLIGLSQSNSSSISLLNNLEIVATSLIALIIFKEKINLKLWIGIILITLASMLLSLNGAELKFNMGSLYALLACLCWGLENNCTKAISNKNPFQIVIIKGLFSGIGSIIIALVLKENTVNYIYILYALLLGFIAYGLSVFTYIVAQRYLGSAKTSAYYAIAPFIGVGLAFIFFNERPYYTFYIALVIMIIGTIFVTLDKFNKKNT